MTFFGVAFGNDVFVAVGEGGTIVTSPDGREWALVHSIANESLRGVAFGKMRSWRSAITGPC